MTDYFVKRYSRNAYYMCVLYWMYIAIGLYFVQKRNVELRMLTILICVVLFFVSLWLGRKINSMGVYLIDEKLYYKCFKSHAINVDCIVAVKIATEKHRGKYNEYEAKGINGEKVYESFHLKEVIPEMLEKCGSIEFNKKFKKSIYFSTVLDEKLIEYLRKKNNSLMIIDDRETRL